MQENPTRKFRRFAFTATVGTYFLIFVGVLVTLATWRLGSMILKRIDRPAPEIIQLTWMLIILATAQVVIGGILFIAGMPDVMRLFHLLLSALYIGVLVLLFPALRYRPALEPGTGSVSRLQWIIPILAFLVFLGITVNWAADTSRGRLPVLGQLPQFEMTAHTGESFGRDDMLGHITIVDFFFTSCPGICPVLNGNMAQLYRALKGSDQVQFVSISVDPDRDSLAALRAYAKGWGVNDDRWVFLRAPIDSVVQVAEKGFMLPADNLPMGHTTRFTLVDPRGRIRGYYDGMDKGSVTLLRDHLRRLAGELP